jgi:hypothetical protein
MVKQDLSARNPNSISPSTRDVVIVKKKVGLYSNLASSVGGWRLCEQLVEKHRTSANIKAAQIYQRMEREAVWNVSICHFDAEPLKIEK